MGFQFVETWSVSATFLWYAWLKCSPSTWGNLGETNSACLPPPDSGLKSSSPTPSFQLTSPSLCSSLYLWRCCFVFVYCHFFLFSTAVAWRQADKGSYKEQAKQLTISLFVPDCLWSFGHSRHFVHKSASWSAFPSAATTLNPECLHWC